MQVKLFFLFSAWLLSTQTFTMNNDKVDHFVGADTNLSQEQINKEQQAIFLQLIDKVYEKASEIELESEQGKRLQELSTKSMRKFNQLFQEAIKSNQLSPLVKLRCEIRDFKKELTSFTSQP